MLLPGKEINTDFMKENTSFLYVILELYKMFFYMYEIHIAWKYVRSWSSGIFCSRKIWRYYNFYKFGSNETNCVALVDWP